MPPHPAAFPRRKAALLLALPVPQRVRAGLRVPRRPAQTVEPLLLNDRCSKDPRSRRTLAPCIGCGARRPGWLAHRRRATGCGHLDWICECIAQRARTRVSDPAGGPRWPGRGLWRRWSRPPVGCVAVWPWLPDTHPSCGLEPQLVSGADIKRAVELVEVPRPVILQQPEKRRARNVAPGPEMTVLSGQPRRRSRSARRTRLQNRRSRSRLHAALSKVAPARRGWRRMPS